jgi:hypothetical protein
MFIFYLRVATDVAGCPIHRRQLGAIAARATQCPEAFLS